MGTAHPPAQPARPGAVLQGAVPGVPRRAPRGLPAPRLRGCSVPVRAALAVPGGALSAAVGRAPERRGCAPPAPHPLPPHGCKWRHRRAGRAAAAPGSLGEIRAHELRRRLRASAVPVPALQVGQRAFGPRSRCPPRAVPQFPVPTLPLSAEGPKGAQRGAARGGDTRGHGCVLPPPPDPPPAAGSCQATRDGGEARTKPQREPPLSPPRTHGLFPRRNWGGGGAAWDARCVSAPWAYGGERSCAALRAGGATRDRDAPPGAGGGQVPGGAGRGGGAGAPPPLRSPSASGAAPPRRPAPPRTAHGPARRSAAMKPLEKLLKKPGAHLPAPLPAPRRHSAAPPEEPPGPAGGEGRRLELRPPEVPPPPPPPPRSPSALSPSELSPGGDRAALSPEPPPPPPPRCCCRCPPAAPAPPERLLSAVLERLPAGGGHGRGCRAGMRVRGEGGGGCCGTAGCCNARCRGAGGAWKRRNGDGGVRGGHPQSGGTAQRFPVNV